VFVEDINIICGISLNVLQEDDFFTGYGLSGNTSLKVITGADYSVTDTAALILNELEPLYERLCTGSIEPLIKEYKENCINIGRKITITSSAPPETGIASDIDVNGALIVNCAGKMVTVRAGDAEM
jgi:biotin-(acetyl-CoA carboxylase) ligase